ncbi:MAG: hypothetical protein JNK79_09655 [Chitinophagaceae bacterium]|nr:hypothetical protein [Chitinophagaceae bacterium]
MKKLLYFSVLIFFAACTGNSPDRTDGFSESAGSPEDSLFNVVMNEHNAAMAKQRQIPGYQQKIDSLAKGKSGSLKETYKSLNTELQSAYDGMETWMHEFSIDTLQDQPEQRIAYLTSEESKIIKVKNDILSAISKADSTLKK